MTEQPRSGGSRFVVDLGSLKLPTVIEEQIESEIRALVLRALADPQLGVPREVERSIFDRFPGRTRGLWIDPDNPELGSWEAPTPDYG